MCVSFIWEHKWSKVGRNPALEIFIKYFLQRVSLVRHRFLWLFFFLIILVLCLSCALVSRWGSEVVLFSHCVDPRDETQVRFCQSAFYMLSHLTTPPQLHFCSQSWPWTHDPPISISLSNDEITAQQHHAWPNQSSKSNLPTRSQSSILQASQKQLQSHIISLGIYLHES